MKKIIAWTAVFVLMLGLAACGGTSEPETAETPEGTVVDAEETVIDAEETAAMSGGWAVAESEAAALPQEVQEAFAKATETLTGAELIPLAYFGSQVVAGTNDAIVCLSRPSVAELEGAGELVVVILYRDLQGGAEIRNIAPLDLGAYAEAEDGGAAEQLSGGWSFPEEFTAGTLPEEAAAAFEKALEGFVGSDLTPMALLGTQVVAGTNYAVLCRTQAVTPDAVPQAQIVFVYADLQGNAEITNIVTLDAGAFNP